MEAIQDLSWMNQLFSDEVVERFAFHGYRAVALRVRSSETQHNPYHLRLLFFPNQSDRPVLSLNLESTILGSFCLTEQLGTEHHNLKPAAENMSYDEFKRWAIQMAEDQLE